MALGARLSEKLGMASAADTQRLSALLERLGLPTQPSREHAASRLLDLMRLDKKNSAGTLRLILWRGIGRAEIVSGVQDADVLAVLL